MMIYHLKGDLLNSDCNIIVHQANCYKKMGAGIAKQIKNAFPEAYQTDVNYPHSPDERLGKISCAFSPNHGGKYIVNLYGQKEWWGTGCKTNYRAFELGLEETMKLVNQLKQKGVLVKIGLPYLIGCGLAGGDWNVVKIIIERVSKKFGHDIYLYEL
jgi:O-acetyl-ADP-ribose deacetylase (regulator of RNase III)